MNNLSIETINAKAPYKVKFMQIGSYVFTSETNVVYAANFVLDDLVRNDNAYQFVIANINHKKSPRDKYVQDTVIAIMEEFFLRNNSTILILYSTSDNKQKARCRLFEHWFKSYDRNHSFIMRTSNVIDEYGIENIASVILRKDNPKKSEILEEFDFSINMFRNKP